MSKVIDFPGKKQEQPDLPTLTLAGVSRLEDGPSSILLVLNRAPTDEEFRAIHDQARDLVHFAYLSTLKEEGE